MKQDGAVTERSVGLRPSTPQDRGFLHRVYASTRAEELERVPWGDAQKEAFVRQQFEAQDLHYREHYPTATYDLVLVGDEPVGRLYVDRWGDEIRVIDIAVLPEHRGGGIGTSLLRDVMDEGRRTGRKVSIHVEIFNRAMQLYERLGFERREVRGVYMLMEWAPNGAKRDAAIQGEG